MKTKKVIVRWPLAAGVLAVVGGLGFSQGILVRHGVGTGKYFLDMSTIGQRSYAAGFINGVFMAPLIEGKDYEWVSECFPAGATDEQVQAIIKKYLDSHPESWHEPLNILSYRAFVLTCPSSPTNRKPPSK